MGADVRKGDGLCPRPSQQPSDQQYMGTAVRTAKTSPASWDAFSDIEAFVDEVLTELAAMAGTRPTRRGPKPPLTGAALRKTVMAIWCVGFCGMQWRAIGQLCDIPFSTLYTLFGVHPATLVAVGAGVTSRPPRRSRRAAFPHRAPIEGRTRPAFGAWAAHPVPVRGLRPSETCRVRLWGRGMCWPLPFLRPAAFPPRSRPPACRPALFEVSSVLCSRPTPHTFRSGFGSSPFRTGPGSPWRRRAA